MNNNGRNDIIKQHIINIPSIILFERSEYFYNMKEGSIRERGSGIELRIRINGKQHSFYGKNEADARKKLREYRRVMKENADSVEYFMNIYQIILRII